jgi:putative ABC transport system ATP-binding protein
MNDPAAKPDRAIEVSQVVKEFDGGAIRALDGVDLNVEKGEFIAITGPSGCGKSTLLHLLAALDRPTSGRITVLGGDLASRRDLDQYRRTEIGLVFQLHHLLPSLSAIENVEVAMMGTKTSRRAQRAKAAELLADVGLADRARTVPTRLSGGERQRVAIARALANEPRLLLADEPTGALDRRSVDEALELLARLRTDRSMTIVMVTHDRYVASAAARIVTMSDGRIVSQDATTEEVNA